MVKLLVVESPNKCKKIEQYLGTGFKVLATAGHFRDLPKGDLGVDLDTFELSYEVNEEKTDVLARLKKAAAAADEVFLATDADREGEAISWHIAEALRLKAPKRVKFIEITEKALRAAVAAPGKIDQDLVDAQQARRVIDRLVGFQVSPLLAPFGPKNSAGRVQSATLHLVVERELARERFTAKPFWTLAAAYQNGLTAKYATVGEDGSLTETRFDSEEAARDVERRAQGPHQVKALDTKPVERKPKPPFTTSTLQQAASVTLSLKPDATMSLAQGLFEKGAITYHRTDSTALSEDSIQMARAYIQATYPEALPPQPPRYAQKKDAQGAHEAIRPTSLDEETPADLSAEEAQLYALVRKRFIACQCAPARFNQTTITLTAGDTTWRARGSVLTFPSFLRFLDADEDEKKDDETEEPRLPAVAAGEVLELKAITVASKTTTPPGRFTQASLVKEMERLGIGRPSTYAATVAVLFARGYCEEEKKWVIPTPKGRIIDEALGAAFSDLIDAAYTAEMETRLDQVADGKRRWKDELRTWYGSFSPLLSAAPSKLAAVAQAHPELAQLVPAAPQATDRTCPSCSQPLLLRTAKGDRKYLACSAYPKCSFIADPNFESFSEPCPTCQGAMMKQVGKFGPYARCIKKECTGRRDLGEADGEPCPICSTPTKDRGDFLSCSKYPECKGAWNKQGLEKAKKAQHKCSKCQRLLVPKKNSHGTYWGCSGYPVCSHIESSLSEKKGEKKGGKKPSARAKS